MKKNKSAPNPCAWPLLSQDIDAAYLFQDMGDIDDDLSSLLVPDLDFTGIVSGPVVPPLPKMPQQTVQTGARPFLGFNSAPLYCIGIRAAVAWFKVLQQTVSVPLKLQYPSASTMSCALAIA